MNLKPNRVVSLMLSYQCKKCKNEHWVNHNEARTPGFLFVCPCCGITNKIEPITISCVMRSLSHLKPIVKPTNKPTLDNQVIRIVQTYGYTKKEAVGLVNKTKDILHKRNTPITKENLLKGCFI